MQDSFMFIVLCLCGYIIWIIYNYLYIYMHMDHEYMIHTDTSDVAM